ncbi:MAG: T9SS type A sorting domain-containing protein [Candidatus Kapabacteria bacterium]|nr:T9SS type A sorting domain-containing protein [Ignavibacteriota bacterium]MCW5884674.1 T9SS type A sorting domain-containing protein [Candidatus Kapabacteria bacterium]
MKKFIAIIGLFTALQISLLSKETSEEVQFNQYYDAIPNVSSCTPGILKQSVIEEVLDKVNHIRSLHKLKPVSYEMAGQQMSMEGCLNMVASGQGGHIDNPSTPCYTPGGGEARMKSNIEYGGGASTPINSIIGWLIDDHNADKEREYMVGHRRAILNPFLTKFSFGRADGTPVSGGFFSSSLFLYQDFTNGNHNGGELDYIAYPYEYYPPSYVNKSFYLSFNAISNPSNLWANQNVTYANTSVTMTDENGNTVNVHSVKNDNEGWGSYPNNLSWKADGLVDNVRYNVSIKNVSVNGSPRDYSYWFKLTNINHTQPPTAPTLEVPANLATGVRLSNAFKWSLTQNTSRYHLQAAEDAAFTKIVINKEGLSTNGYVPNELDYESTYYWRVASSNDAGKSPWSQVFSFTTTSPTPDRPYLAGPANNAVTNTTTPTLFWTSVPGAETYSLQVSRDDTFEGFAVRYTKSNLTDTFDVIPVARLNNETDYWWRVKSVNAGGESTYTPSWKFNTGIPLPAPTLTGPSDGIETNLTPTLTWNVVPGATSYNIQLAERIGFDHGLIVNETKWEDVNFTVPSGLLTDGKTYYWKVRANSSSGSGPFSDPLSFVAKDGTSVSDLTLDSDLRVFPNPTNGNFNIILNNSEIINSVIIRDALGNEILRMNDVKDNNLNINLKQASTGIYFITVFTDSKAYSAKVSILR